MKKILNLLICILGTFAFWHSVAAQEQAYIYLEELIPGVRIYLKTPTTERFKGMYKIMNRNTKKHVYCIEPGVFLKDGVYDAYDSLEGLDIDLTEEDWQYLRLVALYGYGYHDRTDIKWYVAAQYIIWEYLLDGVGEIAFVNENNEPISLYQEEIDTIKTDVSYHYLLPSFLNGTNDTVYEVEMLEKITLVDEYNVLKHYDVAGGNIDLSVEGNELSVSFDYPGTYVIYFSRVYNLLIPSLIYYNPSSQTVMNRGDVKAPWGMVTFQVDFPEVTVTKKSVKDVNLSLEGAVYGVFTNEDYLLMEITTDEFGSFMFTDLYPSTYYIQELVAPYGYQLNSEKIYFDIRYDDIELEVFDKPIEKEIRIEKYLENSNGSFELETSASFQLLQADSGKVITTFAMNEFGKYSLKLPYGNYILRQISSEEGYALADDISIVIDENSEEIQTLVIKNPPIKGSLLLQKKDLNSKELILDQACFQIRKEGSQDFFMLQGMDTFCTENGEIFIDNLPYGNYEIIEIQAPSLYQLNTEPFYVQITEEGQTVFLEVFNRLKSGTLVIEKVDWENLEPLEGVLFGLYDSDQVLIGEYVTDQNGKITIENLFEGFYYIKELKEIDGYQPLEDFLSIEIKDQILSNVKITNRLEIEVPMTGTNEFLLTILFSALCLIIGVYICNYDENH